MTTLQDWRTLVADHLRHQSAHTRSAILASAACVERHLQELDGDVAAALRCALREKEQLCPRSFAQTARRLCRATNLVWHDLLGVLPSPLPVPRSPPRPCSDYVCPPRTFSGDEVEALARVAPSVSPFALVLVRVLFTTGMRIAAAASLTWAAVLSPTRDAVARVATVREKGRVLRAVLLTKLAREALWEAYEITRRPGDDRVLPRSVRQLRNIFYAVCRAAGVTGPHTHPHAARHFVAHTLYAAKNPVCAIAKYLGHRSLTTTNTYYLQLSFDEVTARMNIPWEL